MRFTNYFSLFNEIKDVELAPEEAFVYLRRMPMCIGTEISMRTMFFLVLAATHLEFPIHHTVCTVIFIIIDA